MSWFTKVLLTNSSGVNQSVTHIANDGNLLPAPLCNTRKVLLGVAERADIVIDGRGLEGPLVNTGERMDC